jgi:mannose-6-phosphate isomerase
MSRLESPQPVKAVAIAPNTLASFYRGAGRIAGFRHDSGIDPGQAEDWIASTTSRFGNKSNLGLTRLGGQSLADLLASDPDRWLGPTYLARYGPVGSTLVKLLDAGSRLPLHVHPDRPFARQHLQSEFGKSEAWLVLQADEGAQAHLGFARDIGADELTGWVENQDRAALLGACNVVPLRTGDVIFCPGGIAHSIGAGVLILEIQEMTDFSIMLEWDGFPINHDSLFLGLPRDLALQAVDRGAIKGERLETLIGSSIRRVGPGVAGITSLLPSGADPLFHADQVSPAGAQIELEQQFSLLVFNEGAGRLEYDDGTTQPVQSGDVYLVPYAAGPVRLSGEVSAIRCSSTV